MRRIPRAPSRRKLPHRGAWFSRPDVKQRIEQDAGGVRKDYPDLALQLDDKLETAELVGTIVHRDAGNRIPTTVSLRIELLKGYPETEPCAFETAGLFDRTNIDGHVQGDGRLCLWLPSRSQWRGADPSSAWSWRDGDALRQFVDQVLVFVDRRFVWEATGRKQWPGGESAHYSAGYVEYVHEALGCTLDKLAAFAPGFGERDTVAPYGLCPCESGKLYKFCHRVAVRRLRLDCPPIRSVSFTKYILQRDVRQNSPA